MCTCDPSKGAICHVAGCSLQVVFINQLKLVLVAVFHVPSSAYMHTDMRKKSLGGSSKKIFLIIQCSFKVGGHTEN